MIKVLILYNLEGFYIPFDQSCFYFKNCLFAKNSEAENLLLAGPFRAVYLKANPIHVLQTTKKIGENGGVFFGLNLISSQELINFFLQFSPELVVLSPDLVHDKVLETIKKSLLNCIFHANIESFI